MTITFNCAVNRTLVLLLLWAIAGTSNAQVLSVTGGIPAPNLVDILMDSGIHVTNVTMNCPNGASGSFGGSSNIGLSNGVLLTTGSITNAPGPNNQPGITTNNGASGDAQLDTLLGNNTADACALEFDFNSTCDTFRLNYVFASEEYPEFVGIGFYDGFGIFISGPGIGSPTNIAVVPGTANVVNVGTVNAGTNSQYFVSNAGGTSVQYDGFTVPLEAKFPIIPCSTYHIKIVIADVNDQNWDSGLFLETNSFNCPEVTYDIQLSNSNPTHSNLIEGCQKGILKFTRVGGDTTLAATVAYGSNGTAIMGVDFESMPGNITFPANVTTVYDTIDIYSDDIAEGLEDLTLILYDTLCGPHQFDTTSLNITDQPTVEAGNDTTICAEDSLQLGSAPVAGFSYGWNPTNDIDDSTIPNAKFATASAGLHEYVLMQLDTAGCTATDTIRITVNSLPTSNFTVTSPACLYDTIDVVYTGSEPGTSNFTWNFGTATVISGSGIGPYELEFPTSGTHPISLTVSDATCTSHDYHDTTLVFDPPTMTLDSTDLSCFNSGDGAITLNPSGLTPFTFSWTGPNSYTSSAQSLTGLATGMYHVVFTDSTGCVARDSTFLNEPPDIVLTTTSHDVSCHSGTDGWATVSATGGIGAKTFLWNSTPTQTNDTAFSLYVGTFQVVATDATNCKDSAQVTIDEPAPLAITFDETHAACADSNDGKILTTTAGGHDNYSWSWNPGGQTTDSIINLAPGVYKLTVTDTAYSLLAPGFFLCTFEDSTTITEPLPLLTNMNSNAPLCTGNSNGDATVTALQGTGPYTFSWNTSPVQTTPTAVNLNAGTFIATVTDNNNCVKLDTVILVDPPVITATGTGYDVDCFGANNGTAKVVANGGTPGYTFQWATSPIQFGDTIDSLAPGTYVYDVTDNNGCTYQDSVTIMGPNNLVVSGVGHDALCNGDNSGWATASATGGTAPYTFSWNTSPVQVNDTAFNLSAGSYTLTVTDQKGCTATSLVVVNEPAALSISFNGTDPLCNAGSDGSITTTISGGYGNYSYLWQPGAQTTQNISSLTAGTYVLTLTDTAQVSPLVLCTFVDSIILNEPQPINITITTDSVNCNGGNDGFAYSNITGGTGSFNITWNTSPTQNGDSALNVPAGSYTMNVSDANGCPANSNWDIHEPPVLTLNMSAQNALCDGATDGKAWATVGGGTPSYTYSWNSSPVQTTDTAFNLGAGTYTVTVNDHHGCSIVDSVVVTAPTAIVLTTDSSDVSCNLGSNGQAVVSASGGTPNYTYLWNTSPVQTTDTAFNIAAGTFTVTVTDQQACTATATVNIDEPTALGIGFTPTQPLCFGGNDGDITTVISGGHSNYSYSWQPGGQTTQNITNLVADTYTLTLTDTAYTQSGFVVCTLIDSVVLGQPNPLNSITSGTDPNCNGGTDGSVVAQGILGTPGYTYSWNSSPVQNTKTATGLGAGTFVVTVTDTNGCIKLDSVTLSDPAVITSSLTGYDVDCFGGNSGSAAASISGGTPGYSYSWNTSPVQTTDSIFGVGTGTYTVTVTDNNGCNHIDSVTINEPANLTVTTTGFDALCSGNSDGYATASANGGTAAYSFSWNTSPVQNNDSALNVAAGTYTVTVTDQNSCTATANVTINEPTPISIAFTPTDPNCNAGTDGSINTNVTGGNGNFSFLWSPGSQTTQNISSIAAGTHSLTVTDTAQASPLVTCTFVDSVVVNEPAPVAIAVTTDSVSCNGGTDGSAISVVSGGTGPYTVTWNTSPTQNGDTAVNIPAGSYTVDATDSKGCPGNSNFDIHEPTPISLTMSQQSTLCNASSDGKAWTTASGGTPGYTYSWNTSPVQATDTAFNVSAGTYTVTVTDNEGCSEIDSVTVLEPTAITMTKDSVPVSCNSGSDGVAWVAPSGGTGSFSFSWNSSPVQTNDTASSLPTGTYSVTVTDQNACTATTSVFIDEPGALTLSFTPTYPSCNGASDGAVVSNVAGGHGNYSYSWQPGGQSTANISNVPVGTYTLTVTDTAYHPFGFTLCTIVDSIVLIEPNALVVGVATDSANCNGASDGFAVALISGGTSPYTKTWQTSPVQNGDTATNLPAGNYQLVVQDAIGCLDSAAFTIDEPTAISLTLGQNPTTCNGSMDGDAFVSATGGTGSYSYSWNTSPVQNTDTAFSQGAGTYVIAVTDFHSCTAIDSVTIIEPSPITTSTDSTPAACNGEATGQVWVTASGGTGAFNYSWNTSPVQTTDTAFSLSAGTYNVTVTDANGCTNSTSGVVTDPAAISITLNGVDPACNSGSDGSINATIGGGNGNYSYSWQPGGQTTANISGLTAGTYVLTLTDTSYHGLGFDICVRMDSVTLSEPTPIAITVVTDSVSCNAGGDGQAVATVSGGTAGYTLTWSTSPIQNGDTAFNVPAGNYQLNVVDNQGCQDSSTFIVDEPAVLALTMGMNQASCPGVADGDAFVTVSGGNPSYNYSWNTSPVQNTDTASGLAAGTYAVTVSDKKGCSDIDSVVVSEPSPIVLVTDSTPVTCNGDLDGQTWVTATGGSGGYTYSWNTSPVQSTDTAFNVGAGTYNVTVIDAAGCSVTTNGVVTEASAISISLTGTDPSCNGGGDGSVTGVTSGGYGNFSYLWTPSGQTTANISGLSAGTHVLTLNDTVYHALGFDVCVRMDSVTLSEPTPIAITVATDSVSCNSGADGQAVAIIGGGTPGYTLTWQTSPVQNGDTAFNVPAGTYQLNVVDNQGCADSTNFTIDEPTPMTLSLGQIAASCAAGANGNAFVTPGGGTPGYTYSWNTSPVQSTDTAFNVVAGTYTVTVSDANGCQEIDSITVTQPTPITLVTDSTPVTCNGDPDGQTWVTASGGSGGYTYSWNTSPVQSTDTAFNVAAGTYNVTVTDAAGCSVTTNGVVTEASAISISLTSTDPSCNGGGDGSVTGVTSGGYGNFSYLWTPSGQTTPNISGIGAGTHTLTLTDTNYHQFGFDLCVTVDSIVINEPTPINITIATDSANCNGNSDGQAIATITGGTAGYTLTWQTSPVQNGDTAFNVPAGTYQLNVVDNQGCVDSTNFIVEEPTPMTLSLGQIAASCAAGANGNAFVTPGGGTPGYTYSWNTSPVQTTDTAFNVAAGTYTVTVNDANGCTEIDSITVTQPTPITLVTDSTPVTCNGDLDGQTWVTASGGSGGYTYSWNTSPVQSTDTAFNVAAGTYNVTVTDAAGCTVTTNSTVTEPTAININFAVTDPSCNGATDGSVSTAIVGGNGNFSYSWTPSGQTTMGISNIGAGTHTLTLTDTSYHQFGYDVCVVTDSITVNEPTPINILIATDSANCNGSSDGQAIATITGGTAGYTLTWQTSPVQNGDTVFNVPSGTYQFNVVDNQGCADSTNFTIDEPTPLTLSLGQIAASCAAGANGNAFVTAGGGTPGYTYSWNTSPVQTTDTAFNVAAGTYTVTVSDANGCQEIDSITVMQPTPITLVTDSTPVTCNGDLDGQTWVTASGGSGGYTYSWNTSPVQSTDTAFNVAAGTYNVTVTDAAGCTVTTNSTVTEPTAININFAVTDPSCNGATDGSVSTAIVGGNGNFSYSWIPSGQTTMGISNIGAGTHTLTLTDTSYHQFGYDVCVITDSITVNEPTPINIAIATDSANCNGNSDGQAIATITGGTAGYTLTWQTSPVQNGDTAFNVSAGTYQINVVDNQGCQDSSNFTIDEPTILTSTTAGDNVSCSAGSNGKVWAAANGGTAGYSYQWNSSPIQFGDTASNLPSGTYQVNITDSKGCTKLDSITITEPTPITTTIDTFPAHCNGASDGEMCIKAAGGTPAYSFDWTTSPPQTGDTAHNVPAGNYIVTTTDGNGCQRQDSVMITEPTPVTISFAKTEPPCNGGNTGTAKAIPTGGHNKYSYLWTPTLQTTDSIGGLSVGMQYVTVTDTFDQGASYDLCIYDDSVMINEPAVLTATMSSSNATCSGFSNGTATINPNGGTTPYFYVWNTSPVQTTQTASGLPIGTYTATVTDAQGCTFVDSITITQPTAIQVIFNKQDISCNGLTDGWATAIPVGGTAPYQYFWTTTPPQTTPTINNLAAGIYIATVIDSFGCIGRDTVTIVEPALLTTTANSWPATCNGMSNGTLWTSYTGGTGPFNLSWNTSPIANTDTVNNVPAGTYTIAVTDANGCLATANTSVTEPATLDITLNSTPATCNGDSAGTISVTTTGGNGNYSWLWNPGAYTTPTVNNLPAGTYTVTVSDTANTFGGGTFLCTAIDSVTIAEPLPMLALATKTDVVCFGNNDGTATAVPSGGNGGYSYSWNSSPTQTTQSATNLGPGLYTVIVTDSLGCADTTSTSIVEPPLLTATLSTTPITCNGDDDATISVTPAGGTPGYAYAWSNSATTQNLSNLAPGTYIVTLSDTNGCNLTDSATITQIPLLVATTTATDVLCFGDTNGFATVSATGGNGGYTWSWNTIPTQTTDSIFNLPAGDYIATVTDSKSCTAIDTATVGTPTPLSLTLTDEDISCFGANDGNIKANASGSHGNYSYLWNPTGQTSDSISNLGPGTYTVTVSDTAWINGGSGFQLCQITDSANIFEPSLLIANELHKDVDCNGDSTGWISVSPSGGTSPYSYNWGGLPQVTGGYASDLHAGPYLIVVTDTNGCKTTVNVTLTEPAPYNITISTNDVACNGNATGTAWAVVTGNNPPYTKSWSTNPVQTGDTATNIAAGSYQFTVVDSKSCTATDSFTINEPPQLTWSTNIIQPSCFGFSDGSAAIMTSGGNGNLNIQWNPIGYVGTNPTGLPAGTYDIVITDTAYLPLGNEICTYYDTITIGQPTLIDLQIFSQDVTCNGYSDGQAWVTVTGGTPGYSFAWNTIPVANGNMITNQPAGTYQLNLSDANGCVDSATTTINEPTPISTTVTSTDPTCWYTGDGTATVNASGGTPGYSYVWSLGSPISGSNVTGLSAGTFIVTTTDANNCTKLDSAIITAPPAITSTLTATSTSCFGGSDGQLFVTAGGGTPGYTYQWSNGGTADTINNLATGFYNVTITDNQGCTLTDTAFVSQPPQILINTNWTHPTCWGGNDGMVSAVAGAGNSPYNYSWTPGGWTTSQVTGLTAGTYTVTATDALGCTSTSNVVLIDPAVPNYTITTTPDLCVVPGPDGTAFINVPGSPGNYSFVWNGAGNLTQQMITGLSGGPVSVVVTDTNNCVMTVTDTVPGFTNPIAVTGNDTSFCQGDGGVPIGVNVTGGSGALFYTWWCNASICGLDSINDDDPHALPNDTTTYYVQVTDINGCTSNVDSLVVTVRPKPKANAGPDQYICSGNAPCSIITGSVSGAPGPYTYQWIPGTGLNDSTIANPCARPDTTTIYTLVVNAGNGCTSDYTTLDTASTVVVHVMPDPMVTAGADVDICYGDSVMVNAVGFNAGPGYQYKWSPSTGLSNANIPNPVASPALTTQYTVEISSNGCPGFSDSLTVNVRTLPTNDAGPSVDACYGETVQLDGEAWGDSSATYSYKWWPNVGFVTSDTIENPTITPLGTTTYYFRATTSHGCKGTPDSVTVTVKPSPLAEAGDNVVICGDEDGVELNGGHYFATPDTTAPGNIFYNWSPASFLSDPTIGNPWATTDSTMWFYLHVQHLDCEHTDSVLVMVKEEFAAQAWADTSVVCSGDSVGLHAVGGIGGATFEWLPASSIDDSKSANPVAAPGDTTTFTVIVTEGYCRDTVEVPLNVIPRPNINFLHTTTKGCAPFEINLLETSADALNWIWDFGDGSAPVNGQNPTHLYTDPGKYRITLIAMNMGECADTMESPIIHVGESPIADFTSNPMFPSQMVLPTTNVQFEDLSFAATQWVWNFGDGHSSAQQHPMHVYRDTGSYVVTLTVSNSFGCTNTITHGPFIVVKPELEIPNIFTPNGDGINDYFLIEYTGQEAFSVNIFDRWGQKVYRTNNRTDGGWDGLDMTGKQAPVGTYYYTVRAGKKVWQGNVTLIR